MRSLVLLALALLAAAPAASGAAATLTPADAVARLRDGNQRFVAGRPTPRDWPAAVAATAGGQHPFAAVLGCMDSRVPTEAVFDQGLGDVFGVRVAGNVVNDDELGSLEYAAKVGVTVIVVLGHTRCGAVQGAIDAVRLGHLTGLVAKIEPAVAAARCRDARDDACVTRVAEQNVRQSMREIRERSALLAKALDAGTLRLIGAMYDVATGRVTFLDE